MTESMSSLTRFGPALLIAVLVNVLLFFLMQLMIEQKNMRVVSSTDLLMVDYVRSRDNTPLDTQRERRPPPPKPETPKPPKVERLVTETATATPITPMPQMKLSPSPSLGGPYLGELGGPQWISAGDLVALVRIPPEYPAHARMRRIEGYVDVEFIVDTDGRVRNALVVNAEPPGIFDRAALNSIAHWRFEPKRQDGQPIEVIARQRIEFELSG